MSVVRTDPVPYFHKRLADTIRSSVPLFADDFVLYRNKYSIQDCLTLHRSGEYRKHAIVNYRSNVR